MTVIPFRTSSSPPASSTRGGAPGRVPALPATGSFGSPSGSGGTFVGAYRLERCVAQFGQLAAAGVFTGELIDPRGARIGVGARRTTVAVQAHPTADGLLLELGPVDVNLLGLLVSMDGLSVDVQGSSCEQVVRDVLGHAPHEGSGDPGHRS